MLRCCFTSTETVGLLGTGGQDGHLHFHTAPDLWEEVRGKPVLAVCSVARRLDETKSRHFVCCVRAHVKRSNSLFVPPPTPPPPPRPQPHPRPQQKQNTPKNNNKQTKTKQTTTTTNKQTNKTNNNNKTLEIRLVLGSD